MKITPTVSGRLGIGTQAGGDLGGGLPSPTVTGIRGVPVCETLPTIGQVLTFNGTEWCPDSLTPSGAFLTKTDGEGHTVQDHGATGSTETIDPALGNWHLLTLDANCTITLTAPASGPGCLLQVFLIQDGIGGHTVTWPAEVIWPGGTAPTLTTTADHVDTVTLATYDGGANWYGSFEAGGSALTFATPAIVLGTAAAAGAAATVIRSDATIVAFDATVPVTQAFGDVAATGSVAKAARRDHVHGMPATPTGAGGHILLADGHATPFVFEDLLQMDDGSDFMWSDP